MRIAFNWLRIAEEQLLLTYYQIAVYMVILFKTELTLLKAEEWEWMSLQYT